MSDSVSQISFRIRHPSMDANAIENAVGQAARVKWTLGDARRTPKGDVLDGVREISYCAFAVPEAKTLPVNEAIVSAVERLAPKAAQLSDLATSGAAIEFYVTINRSERGEMIEAATIAALTRLKAGLAIDWSN